MFRSRSIAGQIIRGTLGFGFLAIALLYAQQLGWWTLVPAIGALVCFGGCPMCWIVGLIETVLDRKTHTNCGDGSCGHLKASSGN
jgi:hypothetical protein